MALKPALAEAWFNLTIAYRDARQDGMAIDCADRVLALTPRDTGALIERANARLALGDRAGAMADYDAALAIDPKDRLALYDRALEHDRAHRYTAAIRDAEALLRLAPDDRGAARIRDRARAARESGRADAPAPVAKPPAVP